MNTLSQRQNKQGTTRGALRGLAAGAVLAIVSLAVPPAAAQSGADESAVVKPTDVLERVRSDRKAWESRLQQREARFKTKLDESKQRLAEAEALLARREAEGRRLEAAFESNRVELDDKAQLLKDKIGALKELFGVFQQNASDLIGTFTTSPTSIQYPDRDLWLEGFANRMRDASEVSSADDIKVLWFEMQREITATSRIERLRAPVTDTAGNTAERDIVRVGGFNLISDDPAPMYLQWRAGPQRIEEMQRPAEAPARASVANYLDNDQGLAALAVDPTGGSLLELLALKPDTEERIEQGGLVGKMIIALGALALVIAMIKLIDIVIINARVHLQQRKPQQPSAGNPLGRILGVAQKNQHVDSETLALRLHEQLEREGTRVNFMTVFIALIAAVAPLMGLLGTVVGMINTFQAITLYGTGDPQTMAGGISQALITTVLGLIVAVPAVLLHGLVAARGKAVVEVLKQQCVLLTGDQTEREHQQAGQTA